ncbi:Ppx/GppA phosphatase family protein [Calycomorphotria hydatis]|uniref:Exopolyphosphatase n=1 Tax=Calycomorphotria hydatis TaxID=2528027 RepID=A0A517T518_9PLAN|nr:exopolyphosphatase [Calycomorphotria hydatis]QDT63475.1 Exopolyphosphatase [Calycomorphotria hydatis]
MTTAAQEREQTSPPPVVPAPVAVVDIGTTSIRMAIAEVSVEGEVRILEKLSQVVTLGKDTFTDGSISNSTTERCVKVLRDYQKILRQYDLDNAPRRLRVVATSAVREASNRLTFLDRIYSATGLEVDPIDESEANRITYLSVLPLLRKHRELSDAYCVVVEVGGGSTELVAIRGGDVVSSYNYRLGSLRLSETLEKYHTPTSTARQIMSRRINQTVENIARQLPKPGPNERLELITLGSDMRFAAEHIENTTDEQGLQWISLEDFAHFTDRMFSLSEEELIREYKLSIADAETLCPALLAYLSLATALGVERLLVSSVNLRDGLLLDVSAAQVWTEQAGRQVVNSALELGRKFDFDEPHAIHVSSLAKQIFDQLESEHRLSPRYRLILRLAALLYSVGLYVGTSGYHKHSLYIIQNSELFGLSRKDVLLIGLVARYHRRASPKPTHAYLSSLEREERVAVAKLAAILRIAIALDESHSQRINEVNCTREKNKLIVNVSEVDDLSIEQLAINQSGSLFEEIYGLKVMLRRIAPDYN